MNAANSKTNTFPQNFQLTISSEKRARNYSMAVQNAFDEKEYIHRNLFKLLYGTNFIVNVFGIHMKATIRGPDLDWFMKINGGENQRFMYKIPNKIMMNVSRNWNEMNRIQLKWHEKPNVVRESCTSPFRFRAFLIYLYFFFVSFSIRLKR